MDGPLFIFEPRSVLAIVSIVWAVSGPVLALVLSLVALSSGNRDEEPYLHSSRIVFAAYSVVGMIIIPSFVYILLSALFPGQRPDPFPTVLLINFGNLVVVFGYGLFCHFLAARLRTFLSRDH